MINKIRKMYRCLYISRLKKRGLKVGKNLQLEKGANIDAAFPWLIEIGDNVTFASWVYIVAHDGASKKITGYSRIGNVKIGNNVFIGTKSIIMPNVSIGDNSIIGAGSVVTKNIPKNVVAGGVPAKVIMTIEQYREKNTSALELLPVYGYDHTLAGGVSSKIQAKMKNELGDKGGFIV